MIQRVESVHYIILFREAACVELTFSSRRRPHFSDLPNKRSQKWQWDGRNCDQQARLNHTKRVVSGMLYAIWGVNFLKDNHFIEPFSCHFERDLVTKSSKVPWGWWFLLEPKHLVLLVISLYGVCKTLRYMVQAGHNWLHANTTLAVSTLSTLHIFISMTNLIFKGNEKQRTEYPEGEGAEQILAAFIRKYGRAVLSSTKAADKVSSVDLLYSGKPHRSTYGATTHNLEW